MTGTKLSEVREDAASTSEALYQECVAALDRLGVVVCPCPICGGNPIQPADNFPEPGTTCVGCHGTGIDPEATVEAAVAACSKVPVCVECGNGNEPQGVVLGVCCPHLNTMKRERDEAVELLAEALLEGRPHGRGPRLGICECAWCCLYDMMEERRTNPPIKNRLKAEMVEFDRLRKRLAVLETVWEKAKDWAAGQPEDRDDVYTGDFPLVELIDAVREELECE